MRKGKRRGEERKEAGQEGRNKRPVLGSTVSALTLSGKRWLQESDVGFYGE